MACPLVGFHKALDANPEDWDTRLILADWYEEQGELATAQAIRWQCAHKKRPHHFSGRLTWYNAQSTRAILADWHEDQGDYMASECLRWLAQHNVRPHLENPGEDQGWKTMFTWCNRDEMTYCHRRYGKQHGLPGEVFVRLPQHEHLVTAIASRKFWWEVSGMSRREVEEAAIAAWKAARQAGWEPKA